MSQNSTLDYLNRIKRSLKSSETAIFLQKADCPLGCKNPVCKVCDFGKTLAPRIAGEALCDFPNSLRYGRVEVKEVKK